MSNNINQATLRTAIIVGCIPRNSHAWIDAPKWLDPGHPSIRIKDGVAKVRVPSRACKLVSARELKTVAGYAAPFKWHFEKRFVSNIAELFSLLKECARADRAIIMGDLVGEWNEKPDSLYRRVSSGRGGVIAKQPSRLLSIDIDGAQIPDFDPTDPVKSVELHVMSALGDGFKECGYVIQLTASQSPERGSPARMRLWFLMKNAMSFDGRSALLKVLQAQRPDLAIDRSSCNIAQINYISPPLVIESDQMSIDVIMRPQPVLDVLPERFFLVDGEPLEVDEPSVQIRWNAANGEASTNRLYEPGNELAALEVDGNDGIHERVIAATYSLARNRHEIEPEAVVATILGRLKELSEPGQTLAHRRDRILSAELPNEIQSAYIGALERVRLKSAGLQVEDSCGVPLAEAAQRIKSIFKTSRDGNTLIECTPGVGKTAAALDYVSEISGTVFFFAPDHAKASEVVADARNLGIKTVHIKGRTQDDDEGNPLCLKKSAIELHGGDSTNRFVDSRMICRSWEKVRGDNGKKSIEVRCPEYDRCGYNRQFLVDAHLVVFTHAHLAQPTHKALPEPVLTIIDEDPIGSLRKEQNFTVDQLLAWPDLETLPAITAMVQSLTSGDDLMHGFMRYCAVVAFQVGRDEMELANDLVHAIAHRAERLLQMRMGGIRPQMTPQATFSVITKRSVNSPWITLAEVLRRGLEIGALTSPDVRYERRRSGAQLVTVRQVIEPKARLGRRVVLLDATPNLPALKAVFGGLTVHEFESQENLFEIQVINPSFSDSVIREWIAQPRSPLDDLMEFFRLISQDQSGAIVTRKEFAGQIPASVQGYEVPVMTHGALRGQNGLSERQVLLTLGRLLIPAEAAEGDAAAFYTDIQPGTGDYYRADAKYQVRTRQPDGRYAIQTMVASAQDRRHPDARAEHERRHRLESEFVQARGRLRAVRAKQRKLVINCSSAPTGRPVDVLVEVMNDLIGPSRLSALAHSMCGMVPLRAKFLHESFPDQFESLKSAQEFVQDVRSWFHKKPRMFWMMVQERDGDGSEDGGWRRGSRGRSKEAGEILVVRTWTDIRSRHSLERAVKAPQMAVIRKETEVISDDGFLVEDAAC